MRTNYILIDFENVQPDLILCGSELPINVLIFMGERQTKLSLDLAVSLQPLGKKVEYIQMKGSGPNALDFHIAYFIGKLAEQDPTAYFHVVSKDKGFDPLLRYLRDNDTFSKRVEQLSDIAVLNPVLQGTITEKADAMASSLKERTGGRPRRIEALKNSIQSLFLRSLTDSDVEAIVSELKSKNVVEVNDQSVSYQF